MAIMSSSGVARASTWAVKTVVERLLLDLEPRYPGELAFLGGRWPEMATFLAAHELDG